MQLHIFLGECGGFVEVNSKGNYSWDGTNDQKLTCTHNNNKTAKAKCICDDATVMTFKIKRLICVTFFLLQLAILNQQCSFETLILTKFSGPLYLEYQQFLMSLRKSQDK